jgi:hypothetical protein
LNAESSLDLTPAAELAQRIERLRRPPIQLSPVERSVHFLRGVYSRASFLSAAFYSFVAAGADKNGSSAVQGYPGVVFQHYLLHTSFAALTLDCRKAFDHGKGMTGATFGRASDDCLGKHADFWATRPSVARDDAWAALTFLRTLFRLISRPRQELLSGDSMLEKRVGLIKYHADRSAAHLSLEDYAVHTLDLAHMVAALVFIGEIIRPFDEPWTDKSRFNDLDTAAAQASLALFPRAFSPSMFEHMDISVHARHCWQRPEWGLRYITHQLPFATGWA